MGLSRPVLGAVVLVTGVGSSSTLGYSLIHQYLGDNAAAMSEVVIIGEFGVILPLFTLGVAVAMYFGRGDSVEQSFWSAARPFFHSPIFIALVLGVLVPASVATADNWAIQFVFSLLKVIADSLPLLVALTVGLMLTPIAFRAVLSLALLVAALKLIVEPLVAVASATLLAISALDREILVIEAAMPSGALAAVLAARYGCDAATASTLVIATYVLSLVALPLILFVGL
jgi:predicted permease